MAVTRNNIQYNRVFHKGQEYTGLYRNNVNNLKSGVVAPPFDAITGDITNGRGVLQQDNYRTLESIGDLIVNSRKNIHVTKADGTPLSVFAYYTLTSTFGFAFVPRDIPQSDLPSQIHINIAGQDRSINIADVSGDVNTNFNIRDSGHNLVPCSRINDRNPGSLLPVNTPYTLTGVTGGTLTFSDGVNTFSPAVTPPPVVPDMPPTDRDEFALWLRTQDDVLAYIYGTTGNFGTITSSNKELWRPASDIGTEEHSWNRDVDVYPMVDVRLRAQLVGSSNVNLLFNRNFTRSNSGQYREWHGRPPNAANHSSTRVKHVLDFSRKRQKVIGDTAGEFSGVGGGFYRLLSTNSSTIDVGGVNFINFLQDLNDGQDIFIVTADEDWRPWS